LRTNKLMAEYARRCLECKKLHTTIDRGIIKAPGAGASEFLHIDQAAWSWPKNAKDSKIMNGKLVTSVGSTFIACPGSHLQGDRITELYKPLYPSTPGMKFQLDPTKEDPLQIYARTRKYSIKQGYYVAWNDALFHGVTMNTSKRIATGLYQGYRADVSRPEYEEKTDVSELDDRYNTWRFGTRPLRHPSLDPSHTTPKRWKNYPKAMAAWLAKVDHGSDKFDFSHREVVSKPGTFTPFIKEIPDPNYVPFPLSQEARAMLVGEENVSRYDFSLAD
jgi:hypothetical protein